MGNETSKSYYGPKLKTKLNFETIHVKDPNNIKSVKKELYDLFLEDKLIHIDMVLDETKKLENVIEDIKTENKTLKVSLEKFKAENDKYRKSQEATGIKLKILDEKIKDLETNYIA